MAQTRRLYIQTFPESSTARAAAAADAHKKAHRQRCVDEIIQYWQGRRAVKALAERVLPPELVLTIMQELVKKRAAFTILEPTTDFDRVRKRLLGDSKYSEALETALFEAFLKTSRIRMDFEKWTDPHLVEFLAALPHAIHHLELHCHGDVVSMWPMERPPRVPASLFRATRALQALQSHTRAIESLTLHVRITVEYRLLDLTFDECLRHEWPLDKSSESALKPVKEVMEDVTEAFMGIPTPRRKVFQGKFAHKDFYKPENLRYVAREVKVDGRMTAEEILRAAFV